MSNRNDAVNNSSNIKFHDFQTPGTIRFGVGSISTIKQEIEKRNTSKVFIVSDAGVVKAGLVEKLMELIKPLDIPVVTFSDISKEPTFDDVKKAVGELNGSTSDLVIGIGGGSALDIAKASAALYGKEGLEKYFSGEETIGKRTIDCLLLPTTSGTGAEVTKNAIFGDIEKEVKRGIVSPNLLPDVAIVDPELTFSCPPRVTASSGVDAFTHAIESYISVNASMQTRIYSEKSMELFAHSIVKAVHNGDDLEARTNMSWTSLLGGISLANAGVGAVHALAYPLGGKYHIEHGVANALLMPFVLKVIGITCSKDMVKVANLLNLEYDRAGNYSALDAVVNYLYGLLEDLDLPTSLKALGVERGDLSNLATEASKIDRLLSNTPYKLNEKKILEIYESAYFGIGGDLSNGN
jgi:alcohol dehydrogenase class IV